MLEFIDNECGYSVLPSDSLHSVLLDELANSVKAHFALDSQDATVIADFLSKPENHKKIRNKKSRTFDEPAACRIASLVRSQFKLKDHDFITDEEGLGHQNVYWRCVRARRNSDVGPIHADAWFWKLGGWPFPEGFRRLKVWVPLRQEDDKSALLVVPGSHRHHFKYESLTSADGRIRPNILEDVSKSAIKCPVNIGQCVIFHDKLLHGGSVGSLTRISVEFTCAIKGIGSSLY